MRSARRRRTGPSTPGSGVGAPHPSSDGYITSLRRPKASRRAGRSRTSRPPRRRRPGWQARRKPSSATARKHMTAAIAPRAIWGSGTDVGAPPVRRKVARTPPQTKEPSMQTVSALRTVRRFAHAAACFLVAALLAHSAKAGNVHLSGAIPNGRRHRRKQPGPHRDARLPEHGALGEPRARRMQGRRRRHRRPLGHRAIGTSRTATRRPSSERAGFRRSPTRRSSSRSRTVVVVRSARRTSPCWTMPWATS